MPVVNESDRRKVGLGSDWSPRMIVGHINHTSCSTPDISAALGGSSGHVSLYYNGEFPIQGSKYIHQKVFGPSQPSPNTFSQGTWSPDGHTIIDVGSCLATTSDGLQPNGLEPAVIVMASTLIAMASTLVAMATLRMGDHLVFTPDSGFWSPGRRGEHFKHAGTS